MDAAISSDIDAALDVLVSSAPSTAALASATEFLQAVRGRDDALVIGQSMIQQAADRSSMSPARQRAAVFVGLSMYEAALTATAAAADLSAGRDSLLFTVATLVGQGGKIAITHASRQKMAGLLARCIELSFPQRWPTMVEQLLGILSVQSIAAAEVVATAITDVVTDCKEAADDRADDSGWESGAGTARLPGSRKGEILQGLVATATEVLPPLISLMQAGAAVLQSLNRGAPHATLAAAVAAVPPPLASEIASLASLPPAPLAASVAAADAMVRAAGAASQAAARLLALYPPSACVDSAFLAAISEVWCAAEQAAAALVPGIAAAGLRLAEHVCDALEVVLRRRWALSASPARVPSASAPPTGAEGTASVALQGLDAAEEAVAWLLLDLSSHVCRCSIRIAAPDSHARLDIDALLGLRRATARLAAAALSELWLPLCSTAALRVLVPAAGTAPAPGAAGDRLLAAAAALLGPLRAAPHQSPPVAAGPIPVDIAADGVVVFTIIDAIRPLFAALPASTSASIAAEGCSVCLVDVLRCVPAVSSDTSMGDALALHLLPLLAAVAIKPAGVRATEQGMQSEPLRAVDHASSGLIGDVNDYPLSLAKSCDDLVATCAGLRSAAANDGAEDEEDGDPPEASGGCSIEEQALLFAARRQDACHAIAALLAGVCRDSPSASVALTPAVLCFRDVCAALAATAVAPQNLDAGVRSRGSRSTEERAGDALQHIFCDALVPLLRQRHCASPLSAVAALLSDARDLLLSLMSRCSARSTATGGCGSSYLRASIARMIGAASPLLQWDGCAAAGVGPACGVLLPTALQYIFDAMEEPIAAASDGVSRGAGLALRQVAAAALTRIARGVPALLLPLLAPITEKVGALLSAGSELPAYAALSLRAAMAAIAAVMPDRSASAAFIHHLLAEPMSSLQPFAADGAGETPSKLAASLLSSVGLPAGGLSAVPTDSLGHRTAAACVAAMQLLTLACRSILTVLRTFAVSAPAPVPELQAMWSYYLTPVAVLVSAVRALWHPGFLEGEVDALVETVMIGGTSGPSSCALSAGQAACLAGLLSPTLPHVVSSAPGEGEETGLPHCAPSRVSESAEVILLRKDGRLGDMALILQPPAAELSRWCSAWLAELLSVALRCVVLPLQIPNQVSASGECFLVGYLATTVPALLSTDAPVPLHVRSALLEGLGTPAAAFLKSSGVSRPAWLSLTRALLQFCTASLSACQSAEAALVSVGAGGASGTSFPIEVERALVGLPPAAARAVSTTGGVDDVGVRSAIHYQAVVMELAVTTACEILLGPPTAGLICPPAGQRVRGFAAVLKDVEEALKCRRDVRTGAQDTLAATVPLVRIMVLNSVPSAIPASADVLSSAEAIGLSTLASVCSVVSEVFTSAMGRFSRHLPAGLLRAADGVSASALRLAAVDHALASRACKLFKQIHKESLRPAPGADDHALVEQQCLLQAEFADAASAVTTLRNGLLPRAISSFDSWATAMLQLLLLTEAGGVLLSQAGGLVVPPSASRSAADGPLVGSLSPTPSLALVADAIAGLYASCGAGHGYLLDTGGGSGSAGLLAAAVAAPEIACVGPLSTCSLRSTLHAACSAASPYASTAVDQLRSSSKPVRAGITSMIDASEARFIATLASGGPDAAVAALDRLHSPIEWGLPISAGQTFLQSHCAVFRGALTGACDIGAYR